MDRKELKALAKGQIKGKIGMLFLCYLIIFGVSLVAGLIPYVGAVVGVIVSPPLSLGICMVYLELTKGNEVTVSKLFDGFKFLGKAIWLTVLITVFTLLWSLLLVVPGIMKGYSYSMAYYVLADNPELTAREALNESKRIMAGHRWELFVLQFSFFWWILLVTVTFGIAAIYVAPYEACTTANFYQRIKGQPEAVTDEI